MSDDLVIWTIYWNSSDYPGKHVVRRFVVTRTPDGARPTPDREPTVVVDTIEEARDAIPPGLYCMERFPGDDPVVVEIWM